MRRPITRCPRRQRPRSRGVPRRGAGTDVSILLGFGEPAERPRPGPVADAVVLEHCRDRLRTHRVPGWRRARIRDARGGGAPDADYASLPLERATGGRGGRRQRLPWILLSLRGYEHGPSLSRHGAVDDRYRAADGWRPRRARVFRNGCSRRAGNPPPGGCTLSPRGVGLVRDRLAADHDVVAARS